MEGTVIRLFRELLEDMANELSERIATMSFNELPESIENRLIEALSSLAQMQPFAFGAEYLRGVSPLEVEQMPRTSSVLHLKANMQPSPSDPTDPAQTSFISVDAEMPFGCCT